MSALEHLRRANPVRVSIARDLGGRIDGAWWPREDRITNELPHLVVVLTRLLGEIRSINVNWPPLERPPNINWSGWEHKRQHVISVEGKISCAHLLIVSYATNNGLANMVLRRAAGLDVGPVDQAKRNFAAAASILRAAREQQAYGYPLPPERSATQ